VTTCARTRLRCASAVNGLRCRSCLIDGEVVICGEDGIPIFNRLREGKQVKGEALQAPRFDLSLRPLA
jgi:hypothetical protein